MRDIRALCLLSWLSISAAVAQAQGPSDDADAAQHLDAFLDEVHTFRADFSQELLDGGGQLIEAASGTLSLKRPNRFLWSYREPFEQLVVADAQNLWIYDVELAQVTVAPLEGSISASPAMLLSGDRDVRDGFEVVDNFSEGDIDWITLAPRQDGTDFHWVRVGFDSRTLVGLELVDALDQTTSIRFDDVAVNPEIDDEFFGFIPPAGADVIGQPAVATR